jgi:hypothetical protein
MVVFPQQMYNNIKNNFEEIVSGEEKHPHCTFKSGV